MLSDFDSAFEEFAAPVLDEQFGQRDSIGDLSKAKYHDPTKPDGFPAIELLAPIWANASFDEQFGSSGDAERIERRTCAIRRSAVAAAGIHWFMSGAWFEDPEGNEDSGWMVDEATSEWGATYVTFGLVRIPLLNRNECRSADV